jgi:hypothetical protein
MGRWLKPDVRTGSFHSILFGVGIFACSVDPCTVLSCLYCSFRIFSSLHGAGLPADRRDVAGVGDVRLPAHQERLPQPRRQVCATAVCTSSRETS